VAKRSTPARRLEFALWALIWILWASASLAATHAGKPQRIVSLNLCTDQFVMMLAPPKRIAAISYHAVNPDTSNLAEQAKELPITSTLAEEVLTLKPDLVIAGTLTTRPTINLLRRLGYPVLEVPPADSIEEIRRNVRMIAGAIGETDKGEALIEAMDARLAAAAVDPGDERPIAAPYYGGNNTSGRGTLIDESLRRAGFRNLAAEKGMRGPSRLPLEQLVLDEPDLILLGLSSVRRRSLTIGNLGHPAMLNLLERVPNITIPDRMWICGTPMIADVVARLAAKRQEIVAERASP